jgi:hypothetical protein
MNQSEFVKKVSDLGISLRRFQGEKYSRYWDYLHEEQPTIDDYLYEEWVTGGQDGGSCYGDTDRPVDPEPEPEFADLDAVLENLCPKITFLQYKSVVASVISMGDREVREYYGNYTTYGVKTVRLGALYEKLREKGLLP